MSVFRLTVRMILLACLPVIILLEMHGYAGASGSVDFWPMFQHDTQHTGRSVEVGPQSASLLWSFPANGVPGSAVVGSDGTIYVPTGMLNSDTTGYLYAINPDGTQKWSLPLEILPSSTAPAIAPDGTIYVHGNGKEGNIVAVEKMVAVHPNGTIAWTFIFNGGYGITTSYVQSSPIVGADGTIYVGSQDTKLYAINPNGTLKWAHSPSLSSISSSPVLSPDGNTVYIVDVATTLYAYSTSGTFLWHYVLSDTAMGTDNSQSPSVGQDGTVYVGSPDHHLYAIYSNGTLKWRFLTGSTIRSTPAIAADGTIYIGSNGLYALNPDGTQKWKFSTALFSSASPIIGGDGVIYWRESFTAYAVNSTGTEKWHLSLWPFPSAALDSTWTIGPNGILYVPTSSYFSEGQNGLNAYGSLPNLQVRIGADLKGSYYLQPHEVLVESYSGVQNGPVKVSSNDNSLVFTSERVISGGSFNEVMGYPTNQLTTEYWYPFYDNVSMATWILVGNSSTSSTASVDIYVGGVKKGHYSIAAGGRVTPRYAGLKGGPVRVVSTNGVKIFTSERTTYGPTSTFNEMMGYPASQFTTEYWFPWYDNVSMATWIVVGNSSSTLAAAVDIYVGTTKRSYTVPPKGTISQRYAGVQGGPVRVISTNGVKIITSERTVAGSSFNELIGSPANQFTTEYWYPWYDNISMMTWILVGNPSTTASAKVDIYIGGVKRASYTIAKGGRITPRFNLNMGPVRVVSTNGVKVFTSERALYTGAFNEVMGYPGNKLTTEYWFPWYDSVSMSTDLLIGRP